METKPTAVQELRQRQWAVYYWVVKVINRSRKGNTNSRFYSAEFACDLLVF